MVVLTLFNHARSCSRSVRKQVPNISGAIVYSYAHPQASSLFGQIYREYSGKWVPAEEETERRSGLKFRLCYAMSNTLFIYISKLFQVHLQKL